MKTNFLKLSLLALVLFTASCSSDDDKDTTPEVVVTTKVSDLYAPQSGGQGQPITGDYTKFSFSENKVVTGDKWDIAFRGTFIIVNGGAKVNVDDAGEPARTGSAAISTVSNTFGAVTAFPAASTFKQDAATVYSIPAVSGQGWYNYANTVVSPIAGKVFVVKTHDGKYAKFEILSYYQGAPANPTAESKSRYYTFNFAYQANSTTTF
ncbi:HmuY family protein [Flavobacterium bizetiae]|uniref:HmuY family protein n=1 Tax=Flavobacterium bizetiae TaxID=2704140 RepID=UPI0037570429